MDTTNAYDVAIERLMKGLTSLQEMVDAMPKILDLRIDVLADTVASLAGDVASLHFSGGGTFYCETEDGDPDFENLAEGLGGSGPVSVIADGLFADLDDTSDALRRQTLILKESLQTLKLNYDIFILPQTLVMLVSAFESYLSTMFDAYLASSCRKSQL